MKICFQQWGIESDAAQAWQHEILINEIIDHLQNNTKKS